MTQKVDFASAQLLELGIGLSVVVARRFIEFHNGFSIRDNALDLLPATVEILSQFAVHGHNIILPNDFYALLKRQDITYTLGAAASAATEPIGLVLCMKSKILIGKYPHNC